MKEIVDLGWENGYKGRYVGSWGRAGVLRNGIPVPDTSSLCYAMLCSAGVLARRSAIA